MHQDVATVVAFVASACIYSKSSNPAFSSILLKELIRFQGILHSPP